MKDLAFIVLLAVAGVIAGEVDATMRWAGEWRKGYDRGFADGVVSLEPRTPRERAVDNAICRYAELACSTRK